MLLIDVDDFKQYNDRNGHDAGNVALAAVGHLLIEAVPEYESPIRYGGEEFVVILPHTDSNNAYILAERLREAAEKMTTDYHDEVISWTVSIGLASLEQDWDVPVDEWLERADTALYKAKDSGRNRVVISQPEA